MFPYSEGLLGSNAYSLLNVIDFLCLVAGVYLFAVLHDRRRRSGYLLLAAGTGVLAVRVVQNQLVTAPGQLLRSQTPLGSLSDAIALAAAAILIALGTLSLTHPEAGPNHVSPLRKTLLAAAALMAILASTTVWALPYWQPLQELLNRLAGTGDLGPMQQGVWLAVALAWLGSAWMFWRRELIGAGLSRMLGAALFFWALSLLLVVPDLGANPTLFWSSHVLNVFGSLFLGNALGMLVYQAERASHERQRRLAVIDAVARTGITAPGLDTMVEAATSEATRVMGAEGAAIYMLDAATDRLRRASLTGDCLSDLADELWIDDDTGVAEAARRREPVRFLVDLPAREPHYGAACEAVATPLTGVTDVVGVLVIGAHPGGSFSSDDVETLRNAGSQLGIIIQNMALLERVRQARDRWQETFDSITELVTAHDADGIITSANSAMAEYIGRSEDEIVGRSIEEVYGGAAPQVSESVMRCIATGRSSSREDFEWPGGRIHQVQVTPLKDARDQVIGCVRVARDVTARRRAADRIAQSERRYRELAEGANDVIYTHDLAGGFLYVNRRAVELFGYSRQEVGRLRFLDLVVPESVAQARKYITDIIAGKEADQVELRMVCRDGSVVVLQLRASLMKRDGEPAGIHGIARDVTAEKQLTEQLGQYERLASVGTLIAGIAHELNNPLTVISGYAQMLLSGLSDERRQEALQTIGEQAQRCRTMAQDLLGFARRPDDHLTRMDVNRAVRGVLDLRAYDLRSGNVNVQTHLATGLPAVLTEHGQLQQVLYNLVDNAHYAMARRGGGDLIISTHSANGQVVLTVEDTGPGIPTENLQRIFGPFFTTKPRGDGTGLGLSICRNIVSIYGGTIEAGNRPEGGAVFTVTLPPAVGAAQAPGPEPEAPAVEAPRQLARVLVIEDEVPLAELVSLYLEREGHAVVTALNGEDGLELAVGDDFDLVICDMQLPNMNGDEVLRRLLASRPEMAERVVIATGDVLSPDIREFFEETGLPHIHKPFSLDQLSELVNARMAGRPLVSAEG